MSLIAVKIFLFLLIHAAALRFDSSILIPTGKGILIYPYFFVNLETQGTDGVLMWVAILAAAFIAIGFAFFGLDRLINVKEKRNTL